MHLDELREHARVIAFRRDYAHPHEDARALAQLVPALRAVDVVHSHSSKAGVLARVAAQLARRPAVHTPHGFPWVGTMSAPRRRFGVTVERALAPATAALICVCEFERGLARGKGCGRGGWRSCTTAARRVRTSSPRRSPTVRSSAPSARSGRPRRSTC